MSSHPWYWKAKTYDTTVIAQLNNILWNLDLDYEDDEYPTRFYIAEALLGQKKRA